MATTDLILQFLWPTSTNSDGRTFQIKQIAEAPQDPIELYKFHHPVTGNNTGVTQIHRKNLATQVWEPSGHIEWTSAAAATVYFGGLERVPMRELRRMKKVSSKSRRFKANGSEYKWKVAENGTDIYCVSTRSKTVATWSQEQSTLRVMDRAEGILDRIVVTCFLNLWMKRINQW
ncbi:hypothetical protein POSPLADRAFT_1040916 [Postia placenta MAD-698-R-SB12]|uniref:DUF6593 domain-containing protein n=1 Tax=Postia placenta MAD-698-R-SB12 TaxID=670580 RepID=A0A1X6MS39_9APHY|nr:hypothetical protein POSPLADRAFT_1040916 [Postia placenta MAD-698-R-SB12]OSX59197.1 hypothetical protein POSPLADRAFT_1040916 [Postia placenta MAD-698-R-SB12]